MSQKTFICLDSSLNLTEVPLTQNVRAASRSRSLDLSKPVTLRPRTFMKRHGPPDWAVFTDAFVPHARYFWPGWIHRKKYASKRSAAYKVIAQVWSRASRPVSRKRMSNFLHDYLNQYKLKVTQLLGSTRGSSVEAMRLAPRWVQRLEAELHYAEELQNGTVEPYTELPKKPRPLQPKKPRPPPPKSDSILAGILQIVLKHEDARVQYVGNREKFMETTARRVGLNTWDFEEIWRAANVTLRLSLSASTAGGDVTTPTAPRPPSPALWRLADFRLRAGDYSYPLLKNSTAESLAALRLLMSLVEEHLAHRNYDAHSWENVYRDYHNTGRTASVIMLQYRWRTLLELAAGGRETHDVVQEAARVYKEQCDSILKYKPQEYIGLHDDDFGEVEPFTRETFGRITEEKTEEKSDSVSEDEVALIENVNQTIHIASSDSDSDADSEHDLVIDDLHDFKHDKDDVKPDKYDVTHNRSDFKQDKDDVIHKRSDVKQDKYDDTHDKVGGTKVKDVKHSKFNVKPEKEDDTGGKVNDTNSRVVTNDYCKAMIRKVVAIKPPKKHFRPNRSRSPDLNELQEEMKEDFTELLNLVNADQITIKPSQVEDNYVDKDNINSNLNIKYLDDKQNKDKLSEEVSSSLLKLNELDPGKLQVKIIMDSDSDDNLNIDESFNSDYDRDDTDNDYNKDEIDEQYVEDKKIENVNIKNEKIYEVDVENEEIDTLDIKDKKNNKLEIKNENIDKKIDLNDMNNDNQMKYEIPVDVENDTKLVNIDKLLMEPRVILIDFRKTLPSINENESRINIIDKCNSNTETTNYDDIEKTEHNIEMLSKCRKLSVNIDKIDINNLKNEIKQNPSDKVKSENCKCSTLTKFEESHIKTHENNDTNQNDDKNLITLNDKLKEITQENIENIPENINLEQISNESEESSSRLDGSSVLDRRRVELPHIDEIRKSQRSMITATVAPISVDKDTTSRNINKPSPSSSTSPSVDTNSTLRHMKRNCVLSARLLSRSALRLERCLRRAHHRLQRTRVQKRPRHRKRKLVPSPLPAPSPEDSLQEWIRQKNCNNQYFRVPGVTDTKKTDEKYSKYLTIQDNDNLTVEDNPRIEINVNELKTKEEEKHAAVIDISSDDDCSSTTEIKPNIKRKSILDNCTPSKVPKQDMSHNVIENNAIELHNKNFNNDKTKSILLSDVLSPKNKQVDNISCKHPKIENEEFELKPEIVLKSDSCDDHANLPTVSEQSDNEGVDENQDITANESEDTLSKIIVNAPWSLDKKTDFNNIQVTQNNTCTVNNPMPTPITFGTDKNNIFTPGRTTQASKESIVNILNALENQSTAAIAPDVNQPVVISDTINKTQVILMANELNENMFFSVQNGSITLSYNPKDVVPDNPVGPGVIVAPMKPQVIVPNTDLTNIMLAQNTTNQFALPNQGAVNFENPLPQFNLQTNKLTENPRIKREIQNSRPVSVIKKPFLTITPQCLREPYVFNPEITKTTNYQAPDVILQFKSRSILKPIHKSVPTPQASTSKKTTSNSSAPPCNSSRLSSKAASTSRAGQIPEEPVKRSITRIFINGSKNEREDNQEPELLSVSLFTSLPPLSTPEVISLHRSNQLQFLLRLEPGRPAWRISGGKLVVTSHAGAGGAGGARYVTVAARGASREVRVGGGGGAGGAGTGGVIDLTEEESYTRVSESGELLVCVCTQPRLYVRCITVVWSPVMCASLVRKKAPIYLLSPEDGKLYSTKINIVGV